MNAIATPVQAAHRCFYCDCEMFVRGFVSKRMAREGRGDQPFDLTRDHIMPQRRTREMAPLPAFWSRLNKVEVCQGCNNLKGHIEPLDWLVIMTSEVGARRLASRLSELGFAKREIDAAMSRRKQP